LGCGGSGLGPEEREGDDVPDRRGVGEEQFFFAMT